MSKTSATTARRFATATFAGVVALSLMLPAQLAFAYVYVDGTEYDGATNVEATEASGGGTWSYAAEGQELTLIDYVGGSISAGMQDLTILLQGDNTIQAEGTSSYVCASGGNLTIKGDSSKDGADKPSLTIEGTSTHVAAHSTDKNLTIEDATININAKSATVYAVGNLTVKDSAINRGDANEALTIYATSDKSNVALDGSEINATSVYSTNTMSIDNTDLTVTPSKDAQQQIDAGTYGKPWIEDAVFAVNGITLSGEANGEVKEAIGGDGTPYRSYLYTGSDTKVELKASEKPAYYGKSAATKATSTSTPKTGDDTLTLVFGASAALVLSAAAASLALRKRNEER